MQSPRWLLPLLAASMFFPACSEPTREDYRDSIVQEACESYDRCGHIGPEKKYASMDECAVEQRKNFNDLWPADQCDQGRINKEMFETCQDRARVAACDDSVLDVLSFIAKCNADKVCTDPIE